MRTATVLATLASSVVFLAGSAQAALLTHYTFAEGAGGSTANVGTLGSSLDLTFQADGSGRVPGFSADTPGGYGFSLDNTSAAGGDGGRAVTANPLTTLPDLGTATVTGWYKLQSYANFSRLVNRAANDVAAGSGGWALYFNGGKVILQVVGTTYGFDANWGVVDQWVFFAVSFQDNAIPGAKVTFYRGSPTASAAFVEDAGSLNGFLPGATDQYPLTVAGRHGSFNRALDGWMHDVRIYDEVLSLAQIEAIRGSAVPEPATLGLIGIGGVAMMLRRRCRV